MISFSFLETDIKTFNYVQRYLEYIEKNNNDSILKLDNLLQIEEIEKHLELNNIQGKKERNLESINWIKKYGEKFRIYLNSIKLITLIFLEKRNNCKKNCERNKITFEVFCDIVKVIDSNSELISDIF